MKVIPSADLGYDGSIVVQCSPSGNRYLTSLLKDLSITSADTILDIGCGKGSALRSMTKFKFNTIDGIEIAKHNADIARLNFQKLKLNNVRIFNIDATVFDGYNNYNYFYMYNPFPECIMKLVITRILRQNKKFTVIYNNPVCHKVLMRAGLNLLKVYPDKWGNNINLYSTQSLSSNE